MNPVAMYLLKVVLCSGVLYGYYLLALRNRLFHQWNRFYLLAVVLFALLFPLIPLPSFYPGTADAENSTLYQLLYSSGSDVVLTGKKDVQWNWEQAALLTYTIIALLLTIQLVSGLFKIKRLLQRAPVHQLGKISFVPTDHPAAPFSFFKWLFWKKDLELESDGGQSIFRHELVHIHEKHSVDKLLLQVVLIVFWINPFFWIIRRELQMIHEFIADKKAVGDAGAGVLASMILQSVYGNQYNQLINPFFHQPIKRRLAMLQKTLNKPSNAYLGRVLSLPLFAVLLFACSKKESQQAQKTLAEEQKKTAAYKENTDNIKEVRVNKNDKEKTITIIYKNGTEATYTEAEARAKGLLAAPPPPAPIDSKALVVVDGKTKGTMGQVGDLEKLVPAENIEKVNVLKGDEATKNYGAKGAAGVIEITTREAAGTQPFFEKAEQAPAFPGGKNAWQQFLQKTLDPSVPVQNGAPAGSYTTVIQFKVAADGTLSDFKPITNHGYGMEQAVMALIQKSPKWSPAQQAGKKVTAIHKQPVTFVIAEENGPADNGSAQQRNVPATEPLVIVDDMIKGSGKKVLDAIKPENIETVNVLKDQSAVSKYGEKAKHGAIEITTKKNK